MAGEFGVDLVPDVEGEGHASTLSRPCFRGQAILATLAFYVSTGKAGNV